MYFVMTESGLKPPRTSANQYLWLKEQGRLMEVPADTRLLGDPWFKDLQPGDLLFWGGTYAPTDGRKVNLTHVALYLGHKKKDGNTVMINATDGTQSNGYGGYDFRLPREGSKSVFMGSGTPPGIAKPGN
jgi:cell wall-associated NlpC family hydrolase